MSELIHQFIYNQASISSDSAALYFKDLVISYNQLSESVDAVANGLLSNGLEAGERVAVYLPKQLETVYGLFGTSRAGGVFVPINPLLKASQVAYILKDCNVRTLITTTQRLTQIHECLVSCHDLQRVILTDGNSQKSNPDKHPETIAWNQFVSTTSSFTNHDRIDADIAAILYTSGSTGNPKGVVLSHRNMSTGAKSVSQYLENTPQDRILAVLPLSFDYGLSQLTSAFCAGASVILMNYLLPRDILRALANYKATGLAGVPPIWNLLINLDWPDEISRNLRFITNSGGAMPKATTSALQSLLPDTNIYLMYGLTEAFRSTFLPPNQVSIRPESIGKAIPNAEVMVVREDGSECAPNEPGELVHRGSLVAMGYWNAPEKTVERFKPAPLREQSLPIPEIAVWSGDQVKKDDEGYLYFISRQDEMIKTSGYRVSPTEVEEVAYSLSAVNEVVAIGLPHPILGQAILLLVVSNQEINENDILLHCRKHLPNFMVPQAVRLVTNLPRNQNGKIDRKNLSNSNINEFQEQPS